MQKKILFEGVATALVTPFTDSGIDYEALTRLVNSQIKAGVGALVIGGTTGEASTLTPDERYSLYSRSRELTRGRLPLILGTGSNDTKGAIEYTKMAKDLGADGALIVTPYYNKGTERGIISHYEKIAESVDIPIILYNVPGRTGVNLSISAIEALAENENIVAIKEASDSADRLTELSKFSDRLSLYAGNDSQICVTMALGGLGVISVASNIIPKQIVKITDLCKRCKYKLASEAQTELLPFIKALFSDTNPAPIKYLMAKEGLISPILRLPLSLPPEEKKKLIDEEYGKLLFDK